MTAEALIGSEFRFQVGDGGSPETFTNICSATEVGELGEEKPLVDITTLCSLAREYRNGLADGLEIPVSFNFKAGDSQVAALYADFNANTLRNFRVVTLGSPHAQFDFAATVRAWRITGITAGDNKAGVSFTLKISGGVDWT